MGYIEPFLKQVVRKYYSDNKIEDCCFIFPNRRSMTFFRKHLVDEVKASSAGRPLIAPQMLTESDFFAKAGGMQTADRITLLMELYECYKALNPKAETLDEFIFWGDVLLADFNDVDKHLVDPHQIYTNVSDLKSIQYDWSFLTEEQRQAITNLCGHFKGVSLQAEDGGPDNVKQSFMQIWNILGELYYSFRKSLLEKGLAYEGMVYRSVAEAVAGERPVVDVLIEQFPNVKKFVFVGLNVLNNCEKAVMKRMRDAGIAEFCWDYSGKMIADPLNKSSMFMSENVREFPQAYSWDEVGDHVPVVKVISVPSGVGQAKVASRILQDFCDKTKKEKGDNTKIDMDNWAVVLPDEQLLIPLLNSIPPEIQAINVTMGRSMSSSVIYALMKEISTMQLHLRKRADGWTFYHRQVWAIFSNGIFSKVADKQCLERVKEVKAAAKIYIPQEDFQGIGLMELIFRPVVTDPQAVDGGQIHALAAYLKEVVAGIAARLLAPAEAGDDAAKGASGDVAEDTAAGQVSEIANMTLGFAKEWYCEVTRLDSMNLAVLPSTWLRLLDGVVAPMTVPFKGEPLKGLQIMGPLETRLLDFDNLIILSANEGTFPSRSVSTSFIPPELRRSFGLPTYEYQDAVWAYYFYRMISRADNVWMVYDSRTEGLHTGEESRYIKQLELHFRLPVERFVAQAAVGKSDGVPEIEKTPEDVEKIKNVKMSATTIQNYLACPAKFYYSKVKELASEDEISEIMDAGTIGNVFHETMRALYSGEEAMREDFEKGKKLDNPLKKVDRKYIRNWLRRKDDIRKKVKSLIVQELNSYEVSGRSLVVAEVIVNYVIKTLRRDEELLMDIGADAFTIEGLELYYEVDFHGFTFKGFIDRLDSPGLGQLRVCDYKTGKVLDEDLNITDETAEGTVDLVFGDDNSKRPKIALQIFIYDMFLREPDSPKFDRRGAAGPRKCAANEGILNSIYQTSSMFVSKVPVVRMNDKFYGLMAEALAGTLDEMVDPGKPFSRTEDQRTCEYCDFKKICGR